MEKQASNQPIFISKTEKENIMNTYKAIVKEESNKEVYSMPVKTIIVKEGKGKKAIEKKVDTLLFWEDFENLCTVHDNKDINESYSRGKDNSLLRDTLENVNQLYTKTKGGKYKLESYKGSKVITLSSCPYKLEQLIRGNKKDSELKQTTMGKLHVYNSLISLCNANTIYIFPARNNDTKTGNFLKLVNFRLSNILSSMKTLKTEKLFIFKMGKPELKESKEFFGKLGSLLNKN